MLGPQTQAEPLPSGLVKPSLLLPPHLPWSLGVLWASLSALSATPGHRLPLPQAPSDPYAPWLRGISSFNPAVPPGPRGFQGYLLSGKPLPTSWLPLGVPSSASSWPLRL